MYTIKLALLPKSPYTLYSIQGIKWYKCTTICYVAFKWYKCLVIILICVRTLRHKHYVLFMCYDYEWYKKNCKSAWLTTISNAWQKVVFLIFKLKYNLFRLMCDLDGLIQAWIVWSVIFKEFPQVEKLARIVYGLRSSRINNRISSGIHNSKFKF